MSDNVKIAVLQHMTGRTASMADATSRLVQIDSQTPPSATGPMVEACHELLADIPGIEVQRHESDHPVVNLAVVLKGGQPGPKLILSGHLDTYPIGNNADWRFDPLSGTIENGLIYGRGSADMKGGVVALIETLRMLADMRPFPGEVILALAGDEERMGELGTQRMIDELSLLEGGEVIVADTGGPSVVRLGEKGMLWVDVEADGRSAHGAHGYAGENAIDKLLDALKALRLLENIVPHEPEPVRRILNAAANTHGSDSPEARRTMRTVTVNVGRISGGVSANLVPSAAIAEIDIRIPVGANTKQVEIEMKKLLAPHHMRYKIRRRYEPSWTSTDSGIARACITGASDVFRHAWYDGRIGGSDARLWRRAGYPTVAIGLTPFNLGAPDEAADLDEVPRLAAAIALSAIGFLNGAVVS